MVVSTLPGHHPSQLTDPAGFDHWLEQLEDNRIYRPTQMYIGETDAEYVDIADR